MSSRLPRNSASVEHHYVRRYQNLSKTDWWQTDHTAETLFVGLLQRGWLISYEVRKWLESMAVRLAIPKLNEQSITELRSILADINAALEAHDLDAYGLADQRFHAAIARMSDNDTLIGILTQLTRQVQLIRAMANQDPSIVESTAMERPEIVDAMVADDIDKATRLMEGHIELVRRNATERIGEPATGVTAESIVRAT